MPPIPAKFVIPISSTEGSITCTQAAPQVYILHFSSPPDNRLTPDFCDALVLALDIIQFKLKPGVVITTSSITKFYSNGLDYESAIATRGFFNDVLYPLFRRFLTFPMPTIALLNGHAFAGGLMLAMCHDYRIMNPERGFVCLNELDLGAVIQPGMAGMFHDKLPSPHTIRTLFLEAKRFRAQEALDAQIVDLLGGMDECMGLIKDRKLTEKANSGVYGKLKQEAWRNAIEKIDLGEDGNKDDVKRRGNASEAKETEGRVRVEAWANNGGKIGGFSSRL